MKRFNILILFCMLTAVCVSAQSVKELEKQRKNTLKQLENTGKMLNETKKSEKSSVNKLNILSNNIKERKRLISGINKELTALDEEQDRLENKYTELQAQCTQLKKDYAKLVRETHFSYQQSSPLMFILSAKDFNQMFRRIRYLQTFAEYRKLQVKQIQKVQEEIAQQNDLIEQNKQTKKEALRAQEKQKEQLARDEKKEQMMLDELKKKEKTLLAQQKKQQKKVDELNKKIEKLIAQEAKKKTKSTLTKEEALIAGGFEKNKGRLPWPTESGFISGQFGKQKHPVLDQVTVNNKGIFIQTKAGSTARAVFEGVVTQCFTVGGSNNVIIRHGNYLTVYAGLTNLFVKTGDKVKTKQAIGKIYTDTDNDNKTEMQFQIWKEKEVLNPTLWLTH